MSEDERTDTLGLPAEVTRLIALGDPHGDVLALDEVLKREHGPQSAILSVGDNVGYADGATSSHLCAMLERLKIPSVLGNHEVWSEGGRLFLSAPGLTPQLTPEAQAWLESLPFRIRIQAAALPKVTIGVVHTLPEWAYVKTVSAERLADLEQTQVTFCGHSHKPAIYTIRRGKAVKVRRLDPLSAKGVTIPFDPGARYVVDAGSLGRPCRPRGGICHQRGTYAAFDLRAGTLSLHSVDLTARIQELLQRMHRKPEDTE